jgi:hypothetical protein
MHCVGRTLLSGSGRKARSHPRWTEYAPPRRIAIRSLTTRLNVPVVRNEFEHKFERSHKIDHYLPALGEQEAE